MLPKLPKILIWLLLGIAAFSPLICLADSPEGHSESQRISISVPDISTVSIGFSRSSALNVGRRLEFVAGELLLLLVLTFAVSIVGCFSAIQAGLEQFQLPASLQQFFLILRLTI